MLFGHNLKVSHKDVDIIDCISYIISYIMCIPCGSGAPVKLLSRFSPINI